MPKFYIRHRTEYQYSDVIKESAYKIRLYPIIDETVNLIDHTLKISFSPNIFYSEDFNGNKVGTFSVVEPHQKFVIESFLEVITHKKERSLNEENLVIPWQEVVKLSKNVKFMDYLTTTSKENDLEFMEIVEDVKSKTDSPFLALKELCAFVYNTFEYKKNITNVYTSIDEVWVNKVGVCQDFTNVLLHLVRKIGIPARYVSGYICSNNNGLVGEGATHAWVEAYIPTLGWIGIDPTNNCLVEDKHVRIATGRNYGDCVPVDGVYRGNVKNSLFVKVLVNYDEFKPLEVHFIHPEPILKRNRYLENQRYVQEQQQQQQ